MADVEVLEKNLAETLEFLKPHLSVTPVFGLILGSGLGAITSAKDAAGHPYLSVTSEIHYGDIPHMPRSTAPDHAGKLVFGTIKSKPVVCMAGRFHYYEGYTFKQVTYPIRLMKAMGVQTLIVTNAAGGVNEQFKAGDFMIIRDHINFTGSNPLIGQIHGAQWGPRFPDMSKAYTPQLVALAEAAAGRVGLAMGKDVHKGVYIALSGPSYETPSEIRMVRMFGADAVGMSTVPEVIVASQMGMPVLGISCISNMAAGILDQPLTCEEVKETGARSAQKFCDFVSACVETISPEAAAALTSSHANCRK